MTPKKRDRRPLSVVLAEDNDDHALLIEMALEKVRTRRLELRRAHDGAEALHLVRELPPDLLLLDLKMPGKTGHEVLGELKNDDLLRGIPVAVLTSSDTDRDIARSYGLGGNHFITKPESIAELESQLGMLLRNLDDLRDIRRGAGFVEPTAMSSIQPHFFQRRGFLAFGAALAVVIALLLYALSRGVFG
jgi:CheY-like chemotaxis protein